MLTDLDLIRYKLVEFRDDMEIARRAATFGNRIYELEYGLERLGD
jgi:hypothetical protein